MQELVRQLAGLLEEKGWLFATAESCTGGLVACGYTDLAGSSKTFDRGFVTYSNQAKTDMLGVPSDLIAQHGAVSEQVARAMVIGACENSFARAAVALTGIAGPGGGSADKPVGLVYIGSKADQKVQVNRYVFENMPRDAVRKAAARQALQDVISLLN